MHVCIVMMLAQSADDELSSCSEVWWYTRPLKVSLIYFTTVIFLYTEETTKKPKQFLIAAKRKKDYESSSALYHSTSHSSPGLCVCVVTHLAPQHGFDSYPGYEVEPDDMQHLEDQQ